LRGVQGGGFLEKSPPGRRRHHAPGNIESDTESNKFLTVMTDQSGAAACCPPEAHCVCSRLLTPNILHSAGEKEYEVKYRHSNLEIYPNPD